MSIQGISAGGVNLTQTSQIRASFQSMYREASQIIDPEIADMVKSIGDQLSAGIPSGDIIASALHKLLDSKAGNSVKGAAGTTSPATKAFVQSQVGDILQGGVSSISELKQLMLLMMDYPGAFDGNLISNIASAIQEFVDNSVTGKPDERHVQDILHVLAQMVDAAGSNTNLSLIKDQLEKVADKISAPDGIAQGGVTESNAQGLSTPDSATHSINPLFKSTETFFHASSQLDPLNPAALNYDPADAAEAAQEAGYIVPGLGVQASAQLQALLANGHVTDPNRVEGANAARNAVDATRNDALLQQPKDKVQAAKVTDKVAPTPKSDAASLQSERPAQPSAKILAKPQDVKIDQLQQKANPTVAAKFEKLVTSLKLESKSKLPQDKFKDMMQRTIQMLQTKMPDAFQLSQGAMSGYQLFKRPFNRDRFKKALKQDPNAVSALLYGALMDVLKGELTEVMLHIPTE